MCTCTYKPIKGLQNFWKHPTLSSQHILADNVLCNSLLSSSLSVCCHHFNPYIWESLWFLEYAAYNCPWLTTGWGKKTPTLSNACPHNSLMVMAYDKQAGNWVLSKVNGMLGLLEVNFILGMSLHLPISEPQIKEASIECQCMVTTSKLVPFQSSFCIEMLRRSIGIELGFKNNLRGSIPDDIRVFGNSSG